MVDEGEREREGRPTSIAAVSACFTLHIAQVQQAQDRGVGRWVACMVIN